MSWDKLQVKRIDTDVNGNLVIYINQSVMTPRTYICSDITPCTDTICDCSASVNSPFHNSFCFDVRFILDDYTEFQSFLSDTDNTICSLISDNSVEWFGAFKSYEDVLRTIYISSIIHPLEAWTYYPPRLRIELEQAFDQNGNPSGFFKGHKNDFLKLYDDESSIYLTTTQIHNQLEPHAFYNMLLELECLVIHDNNVRCKWRLLNILIG